MIKAYDTCQAVVININLSDQRTRLDIKSPEFKFSFFY
jgi:hypothetical protein